MTGHSLAPLVARLRERKPNDHAALRKAANDAVRRLRKCQPGMDDITLALIAQSVADDLEHAVR